MPSPIHGLRGSVFEDMINFTNDRYREKGLALIQKVPTPIIPTEFDKSSRHITMAYFGQKSTVDYIGAVQGLPVCFDAKECAVDTFSLSNVHAHQLKFAKDFEIQGGIAFFLIYFANRNVVYYMRTDELNAFCDRAVTGRKSVRFDELDDGFFIRDVKGMFVPYLDAINADIDKRQ
jgi:recombination protein U